MDYHIHMLVDSMDKDMDMDTGMGRMVLAEKTRYQVTPQQNPLIIQPQMVRQRKRIYYLHDDAVQRNDVAFVYLLFVSVLPYTTSYATNT